MVCLSLIFIVSCEKEEKATTPQTEELQCDANCGSDGLILKDGLRSVIFASLMPSTVSLEMVLAAPADLEIFAQDCCIRDDVVEIWVDGCLIATVDSRYGDWGTHLGETYTVSLLAGSHMIEYVQVISETIGESGWSVSEIESDYTGDFCIPCDDDCDGVFNEVDNCIDAFNPGQENCDGDEFGDVCDEDDDNDGVLDVNDAYICSDMTATVIIDGCDTYVINMVFLDGATMMDLINECAANAMNHGEFVSCVSHLTNGWKSDGYISGKEKGKIMDCAANAYIP